MSDYYDSSTAVRPATLARIFIDGQPDQFGRVWPLALSGVTHDGRSITAARNIHPSLHSVKAALRCAESAGMTRLEITADCCG